MISFVLLKKKKKKKKISRYVLFQFLHAIYSNTVIMSTTLSPSQAFTTGISHFSYCFKRVLAFVTAMCIIPLLQGSVAVVIVTPVVRLCSSCVTVSAACYHCTSSVDYYRPFHNTRFAQ